MKIPLPVKTNVTGANEEDRIRIVFKKLAGNEDEEALGKVHFGCDLKMDGGVGSFEDTI